VQSTGKTHDCNIVPCRVAAVVELVRVRRGSLRHCLGGFEGNTGVGVAKWVREGEIGRVADDINAHAYGARVGCVIRDCAGVRMGHFDGFLSVVFVH
jgi:hypothetical protein